VLETSVRIVKKSYKASDSECTNDDKLWFVMSAVPSMVVVKKGQIYSCSGFRFLQKAQNVNSFLTKKIFRQQSMLLFTPRVRARRLVVQMRSSWGACSIIFDKPLFLRVSHRPRAHLNSWTSVPVRACLDFGCKANRNQLFLTLRFD